MVVLTIFMKNSVHFLSKNVIPISFANFGQAAITKNFGMSKTEAYLGSLKSIENRKFLKVYGAKVT